jgi:hypothetical protein
MRIQSSLEPGGTLELMDIIYPTMSDDGTLTDDHASQQWSRLLNEGFAANGRPLDTALQYKDWLPKAGFVDVVEVKEKWPINVWPRDPRYKQIGTYTTPHQPTLKVCVQAALIRSL